MNSINAIVAASTLLFGVVHTTSEGAGAWGDVNTLVQTKFSSDEPNKTNKNNLVAFNPNLVGFNQKQFRRCECTIPNSQLRAQFQKRTLTAKPNFKSTLITVSVSQVGLLNASLACNKPMVDKVVIITTPNDYATQQVCDNETTFCVLTDAFYLNGDPFNKGRAIRAVQQALHKDASNDDSVILLVDADVCLPGDFWSTPPLSSTTDSSIPANLTIPEGVLYSVVDRCMYANAADYSRGWPAIQAKWDFNTLGMVQLYRSYSAAPLYDDNFPTAGTSDLMFAKKFTKADVLPTSVSHMGISPKPSHWDGKLETMQFYNEWASATPPPDGACPCCDTNHGRLCEVRGQHIHCKDNASGRWVED